MRPVVVLALTCSIAAQKVVKLDLQGTHPAEALKGRFNKRNTVAADVANDRILYLLNVSIGTPAQQFELQLDTGSSDLWVLDQGVELCQKQGECEGGFLNPKTSSTFEDAYPGAFHIAYVDGTGATGDYVLDTVVVGGATITNQTLGLATNSTVNRGLLGVGFPDNEASCMSLLNRSQLCYPSVVDQLAGQGKINTRAYSLWLNDYNASTGSILFGGIDRSKYTGYLIQLPIIPNLDSHDGSLQDFAVAWTNLTITTPNGVQSYWNPSYDSAAVLDSGTSLANFPNDLVDSLYEQFGAYVLNNATGEAIAPCYLRTSDATIDFEFGGPGGPTIHVPIREFLIDTDNLLYKIWHELGGTEYCILGFVYANEGAVILGDTFLRSAYVVYDLENKQVAIANTDFNGGPSNIFEIGNFSNNAIPGVSSTAIAVTTAVQGVLATTSDTSILGPETVSASSAAGGGTTTVSVSSGSKPPLGAFTTAKYTGQGSYQTSSSGAASSGSPTLSTGVEIVFIMAFGGLLVMFGSGSLLL